jgi:catechol 2,3-dioxygenase
VSIDPALSLGPVALTVADLARSLNYYTEAIGLTVLDQSPTAATLGVAGEPLLLLTEQPGAAEWPRGGRSYTGLYHFAILVPTRADLGRWLRHWLELGLPLPGQGDHLVSEALYLEDPDGHGIEIYRDRPRDEWRHRDGHIQMATDPVDLHGVLAAADQEGLPWSGLPAGTRIGHIHLQIGDIPTARTFYSDVLGFDVMAAMPTALFMSAGGYHHHIGANIWHSRGASEAPDDSVQLTSFTLILSDANALAALTERLDAAGVAYEQDGAGVTLQDPWSIVLKFVANS